jgi:multidrug resistance protein MdtO
MAMLLSTVAFVMIAPPVYPTEAGFYNGLHGACMQVCGVILGTLGQLLWWREDPAKMLLQDLGRSLRAVEEMGHRWASARPAMESEILPSVELRAAASRMTRQLDWLRQAEGEDRWLRQRHTEQIKLITDVQLLVLAALEFERRAMATAAFGGLPAEPLQRLRLVGYECERLRMAIENHQAPVAPAFQIAPAARGDGPGGLNELETLSGAVGGLERAIGRLPGTLAFLNAGQASSAAPPVREPVAPRGFFTPAFHLTNVEMMQFAMKVALAASFCGLLYQALAWPGIGTCVMTAVLVAQAHFGAGLHKGVLRFIGAALAGAAALFVIVALMPNMVSLASLLVITAILAFISSWIATGSTRVAYLGVQMGITLYLVLFDGAGPAVALLPARDRLIGILVGILVMGVIDIALWPVFTRSALRSKFASILHRMARLQQVAATGDERQKCKESVGIHREVAEAMALQEELVFEPTAADAAADTERRIVLRVLNRLQEVFLHVLEAARQRALLQQRELPAPVATAIRQVDEKVVAKLEALATTLQAPATPTHVGVDSALTAFEQTLHALPPSSDTPASLHAFTGAVQRLANSLDGLETDIRAALAEPALAPVQARTGPIAPLERGARA